MGESEQTTSRPADAGNPPPAAGNPRPAPIVSRLRSLLEMQSALALEEREEDVLGVGVAAAVEILGADTGIGVLRDGAGGTQLRSGWGEGRRLARHEIEVLYRTLAEGLTPVRDGVAAQVLIEGDAVPAPVRSRGIGSILAQALGSGAERRGMLILAQRASGPFDRETGLVAEILANQIAAHLERARRLAQAHRAADRVQEEVESATRDLRERNQELEALNAVAAAVSPSFDLDRQLEVSLRKAAEVTRHTAAALYLIEPDGEDSEVLRYAHAIGGAAVVERARQVQARRGEGTLGQVWESGEPVALADLGADPEMGGCEALASAGYRGLICLPLRARGRTLGVMELLTDEIRPYSADAVRLAQAVAGQVGLGVQNTRAFSDVMRYSLELEGRAEARGREAEVRERQTRALVGALEALSRPDPERDALEAALGSIASLAGAESALLHVLEPERRRRGGDGGLRLRAAHGLPEDLRLALAEVGAEDPIIGRAAGMGETIAASDLRGDEDGAGGAIARAGFRVAVAVPVAWRGSVRGVATLLLRSDPLLGKDERAAVVSLAALLALALGGPSGPAPREESPHPPAPIPVPLVQAQKLESVGTLAGGIAHDFNNIVGAILGCASYIKSLVTQDNPIFRQAATIEEQSHRAAALTQQLLAFARGGQYRLETVDLNALVAETVSFLSKSLDKNIVIEVHTEPDLPPVEADGGQMRQILLNVGLNARDSLPDGGRITFETRVAHLDGDFTRSHPDLRPGDYVEILISDTGIGMPPEVLDRAFEPFFTTKPAGEGSGLGLSVVYGIVKNHRGHVSLSSAPRIGTTARIYLPAAARRGAAVPEVAVPAAVESAPPAVETAAPATPEPAAVPAPACGRILVVDDEDAIRQVAQDILQLRGFEVVLAKDGVEALEIYREHWGRIAFVLLDMMMPRLSGLETFRRLRGMDRGVRVLLCSGYSHGEQVQRAIKEGAVGLLAKPFTMTELLAWAEKLGRQNARPAA